MTRKSKARFGLKRTYKLNPTVKALRNALLAGMMVASLAPTAATAAPFRYVAIEDIAPFDDSFVFNEEDLAAVAENIAAGILAISFNGDTGVVNYGNISALADASLGLHGNSAIAAGIYAIAQYEAVIINDGDISATAIAEANGSAQAYGLWAYGGESARIENDGDITVSASSEYGNAIATGIHAASGGDVVVENTGLITVTALVSYSENNGYATTASAIGIDAIGYSVSVYNTGDINAFASNDLYFGASVAIGINAEAYADITISNSGDITLSGSSGDGYARAGYYPNYVYVTGDFVATGINAESTYGSISVTNSGDINIDSLNEEGVAGGFRSGDSFTGISATTLLGDSTVSNSGDISLTGAETAYGIVATTDDVTQYYACPPPYDNGNYVCYNRFGGGDATVVNSGDITISVGVEQPYDASFAAGIITGTGKYGGDATVSNSGDITVINTAGGNATGITANTTGKYSYGNSIISNSGDITVMASYSATGIGAYSNNEARIYNSGDISVETEEARSRGLYAIATSSGIGFISNSGDISVVGGIGAVGAGASGAYGATTLNSGDVSVTSTVYETYYSSYYGQQVYLGGWAYGLFASTRLTGVATVINSGDIDVHGVNKGAGVSANSRFGSTYIANSGDLNVVGEITTAYGIQTKGSSYEEFLDGETGYTTVLNSGDITVSGGFLAGGIIAVSQFGNILIENAGDITATADAGASFGISAYTSFGLLDIVNIGDLTVAAVGDASGILAGTSGYVGSYYDFPSDISVVNDGQISIVAEYGHGVGIQAASTQGDVSIENFNDVNVDSYLSALGIRANSSYGLVSIENAGDVSVSSSTYSASGLRAQSFYGDVSITNTGDVSASAYSLTQGIVALSYYGSASIDNSGDVTATSSDGYSQAVALRSYYGSTLDNSGTITAGAGDYALAVSITGAAGVINNTGTISGSILTDAGDDLISNTDGGLITLSNDSIDLGAGDDTIYNGEDSTISMLNSSIVFGAGYNSFYNYGELVVNGLNNSIDMGTTYSEYGSGSTFYNYGNSIHMEDGATNDALTIIGNFAGDGSIFVDVDGQSHSSDRLYIEGDVVSGTANVVDVNLLSMPDASDIVDGITIPIVTVSGANVAGNFVLGDVDFVNNTLFTTDYRLVRETPATDFSLAFEVTGLSTAGILFSTVGPAMQNLWFSSLGTMYQRQGGERNFEEGGAQDTQGAAGAWFRLYGSDGSLSPDAKRSNFGAGGSQDFSISTSGIEAGFGYSFNTEWTIGLFGGFNDGSFKPDAGGNVKIDGNTWGGYVTYTPGNGFYADLSYRDISYDGDALISGTKESLDGSASGYSLEMGYGFKMSSGLEIEPQLQYSDVSVDFDNIAYNSGGFELTDGDASQLRVGVAARQSFNQDSGVWTPYAALSYVENYSGSNRYLIGGALDGQVDTSGGSMLLELGTDARYGHFMFNAGVGWQNGGAFDSVLTGQVNVRYSW